MIPKPHPASAVRLAVLAGVFGLPFWTVGVAPLFGWFVHAFGPWSPVAFGVAGLCWAEVAGAVAFPLAHAAAGAVSVACMNGGIDA